MELTSEISRDFKKWVLYSVGSKDIQLIYHLYKTLRNTKDYEPVSITKNNDLGEISYTISIDGITESLEINENQRMEFIQYLNKNYFGSEDADDFMVAKRRDLEIAGNHQLIGARKTDFLNDKKAYKLHQHPKERRYYKIKLTFSILIYTAILGFLIMVALTDQSIMLSVIPFLIACFVFWLINRVIQGIFIGLIRGNSIQVTKEQYPEIYDIVEAQANEMGIKELPEIYIASGHFNAFVTKFSRSHVMLLYSEVIETALKGNYDVLKYIIAHELCHIKQKHLSKRTYLLPSRIIPFLSLAYSRACEYTCDRSGYHFSPKGAIEGILIMTTGKEIHSKFNIEIHIKNSLQNEGFWTWWSEKFLTHPHHYKRLIAIKKYSEFN